MEAHVSRVRSPGRDMDAINKNVRAPPNFLHILLNYICVFYSIAQAIYFLLY